MDLNCPHFKICSGCSRDKALEDLTSYKQARQFFADRNFFSFQLHLGSPKGWRTRAKLAVRGDSKHPKLGLFEKGSHHIVDIPQCQVHHPSINQAANLLRDWMQTFEIHPYDELSGAGFLRYVQLAVERESGRVQLVLVINEKEDNWLKNIKNIEAIKVLWEKHPTLWHSVWINFNPKRDNIIFSPRWHKLFGEEGLWETVGKREVCFHPGSFAQANLEMLEQLVERIRQNILPDAAAVEFYAGVGVIGIVLVDLCRSICCVEIAPKAEMCFDMAVSRLPENLAGRLSFKRATAASQVDLLKHSDVVIVDPPRKGLEKGVLEALCQPNQLKQLIYVSCGWESFQDDCQKLMAAGWLISYAEAFLFFPGSEHIEILAIFKK